MRRTALLLTTALVIAASEASGAKTPPKFMLELQQKGVLPTVTHGGIPNQGMALGKSRGGAHVHNAPGVDAGGQATYSNLGHDANAQFISWYGLNAVNSCHSYDYSYVLCLTETTAVPFKGAGRDVSKIIVPIYALAGTFDVGLYKDANGVPGDVIASGTTSGGSVSYCCTALRTVSIGHHFLKAGQQYWVQVKAAPQSVGLWLTEDTDFSGGQPYDWQYSCFASGTWNYTYEPCRGSAPHAGQTSSYTTGWLASNVSPYRPALKVK